MGMVLQASCACGFAGQAAHGAGMLDFEVAHSAPATCTTCRDVVTVDLCAPGARVCPAGHPCEPCAVVSAPGGVPPPGLDRSAMSWSGPHGTHSMVPLTGSTCPACGQATLAFEPGLCFD